MPVPDFDDPGLLTEPETALLTDLYELTMSASYLRRGLDHPAVFELFARRLPPHRDWLLAAGLGPSLRLITELRFEREELAYLASIGFEQEFRDYLAGLRFEGDVDAMPEGTVCFAAEPMVRVRGRRIEAQLVETLLLNQINFQTMVATKAARVALAAGAGQPGAGSAVVDFSPRRDHGIDAAMKVARSAAVAGIGGTSNVAAAMRYGLEAVGTMAHSYVLSFESEIEAFRAFLEDHPDRTVLLVDTYDTVQGVRNAIAAARDTRATLTGIRLDSGDLLELSRAARRILDEAGLEETRIAASGDLEEDRIYELVAAGAPIDLWGVGTDLGTSRDSPVVNGVYKLVADARADGTWRDVAKASPHKETVGGAKQVYRRIEGGAMVGDTIADDDERLDGEALLVPVVREGQIVHREPLERVRDRAVAQLGALPAALRLPRPGARPDPYPVALSPRLAERARLSHGGR